MLRLVFFVFAALLLGSSLPVLEAAPPPEIKAVDADNHTIVLNRRGLVGVVLVTSEDSQDAARLASRAMNPFQGKPAFQLVIVADLRDSIAAWVPSIVLNRMRKSLDKQTVELKPYYLKNGNTDDPRPHCYLVPDFKGTVVPQLGFNGNPSHLHAVVYGPDGRVIQHWENVDNLGHFQTVVRTALQAVGRTRP